MFPFRNILYPTNFSAHARAALKYAAAFARQGDGHVVLLNVQGAKVPPNLLTLPDYVFEHQENNWLRQVRNDAKQVLRDPLFSGIDVDALIVDGEPVAEIARIVVAHQIDLVTIVTRARKALSRALG